MDPLPEEFYTLTYDASVPDWPGEIDFYQALAAGVRATGGSVLEVACGTGRVAIRLAQAGANLVGLDLSPAMIDVARNKSAGIENIRWVVADMRGFDLDQGFDLVLIPGHAFQNLTTPQDQAACLACIRRHLTPDGRIVIHLDPPDMVWLGSLCGDKGGVFEPAEMFTHPQTGQPIQALRAWWYEPSTQTATTQTIWEVLDGEGKVIDRITRHPVRLHSVFRFEIEHLLHRAGFEMVAVYGNFFQQALGDDSTDMVWIAKPA